MADEEKSGEQESSGSAEEVTPAGEPTDAQIFDNIETLAGAISTARGHPLLYILYPSMGMIGETHSTKLYQKFLENQRFEHLDVILHSTGGDIHEAYDIIKLCRQYTEGEVTVFVPMRAMSAATLIALGADQVILTKIGKLGPLDPQIPHPERGNFVPVRSITDIPDVLEEALAPTTGDVSVKEKGDAIVKPIAKQVDPYYLTQHDKTADLAREYGRKLLSRRNISDTRAKRCLDYLIEYPTHSYSVDLHEIQNNPSLNNVIDCYDISKADAGNEVEMELIYLINFYMYWDHKHIKRDEARVDPTMEFVYPEDTEQQELNDVDQPDDEVEDAVELAEEN